MGSTLATRLKRVEARVQPPTLPRVLLYYATEEGRAQTPAAVQTALFPVGGDAARGGEGTSHTAHTTKEACSPRAGCERSHA